jgi:hypothetical protein
MDLHFFVVSGEQLTFSMTEDVYFLVGLPFRGRALAIDPHLPGEERVENMVIKTKCEHGYLNIVSGQIGKCRHKLISLVSP